MREFKGVHQDRLKLRFSMPKGKISRRELLNLALPRYQVIPFVEPALCRESQECGLCLDTCPLKALKVEGGKTVVDTTLCSGCGGCVAACPYRAIVYPTFSPEQLDKEMEGLLIAGGVTPEPGIVVFFCQSCLPVAGEGSTEQLTYPPNALLLKVPCLAIVSPWLMLRPFDLGSRGLALVFSQSQCPAGSESLRWQENIRFVQGLLGCWDIEPERIRVFDVADDSPNIARKLAQFTEELVELGPTPLRGAEPTLVPADGLLLPALIKGLGNKIGGSPKGTVTAGIVPFGKLKLDGSQCSGCSLCARDCPTGALAVSSGADAYRLLFRHDRCVACGRCVRVCPGKCLQLERILELERIASPAVVLLEDDIARCRQCGSVIGPRTMIEKLQAKLRTMGDPLTAHLELCPGCKVKQFGLGRTAPEPTQDKNNGRIT